MITTALFNVFYVFALGATQLISGFGEVPQNNFLSLSIVQFNTFFSSLNDFLPLDTILQIVAFDLTFEGLFFLYKLLRWSYQKVPFVN